ncbi:uncharacterized protein B0H64DRAFT_376031 [Chaetomium fimeti]|uniref:Uncharacterized protein n=1 Tax=Chaetomium fimeti TaxID=1854472 RepID=A0AAE0HAN4_9PEZI|nr:hypothetical protein B0H64DRAFT_376031 [Chaetomium fimeti]
MTNRKDLFENARNSGVQTKLAKLFHMGTDRSMGDSIGLESELVKRYSLSNPERRFAELMEDPRYAAEVSSLLAKKRSHRGYLVTGFMTTTNSAWSKSATDDKSLKTGVTLDPSLITSGAPSGLDIGVDTSHNVSGSNQSEWVSPNEEIFAVSYVSLKFEGSGLLGRGPKKPVIGDVVLASNGHAALSVGVQTHSDDGGSGSDSGSDSEQDDDPPVGEVVVLTDEEPVIEGIDHFFEVPIGF